MTHFRMGIRMFVPVLMSILAERRGSCNASVNFVVEDTRQVVSENNFDNAKGLTDTQRFKPSVFVLPWIGEGRGGRKIFNQAQNDSSLSQRILTTIVLLLFTSLCLPGCKKIIAIDPPIQSVIGKEIYNNNAGAASVLTGIYASMSQGSFVNGLNGISLGTGLSSDELTLYTGSLNLSLEYLYQNEANSSLGNYFWSNLYTYVFKANAAIEGVTASSGISSAVKQQLLGEAKFIRAFCYFYLINVYGDVPLLISTDPKINTNAGRTDKALIFQQIIRDLLEAQQSLNNNFVASDAETITNERVRPNKVTATALLARVYLYTEQWDKAEVQASSIIANKNYSLVPLDQVFLMNSNETIWSLQNSIATYNFDSVLFNFLLSDAGPTDSHPVYLSDQLWQAFETDDKRKEKWTSTLVSNGTVYPFANKYKTDLSTTSVIEYPIIFRLGEQYLIRAEARAQQGKIIGAESAQADLDLIRVRAGLLGTLATTQSEILEAINKERRIELFTEWGNRWFDLKRQHRIDLIMPSVCLLKSGSWSSFKALFPIPVGDIQSNPALRGHQNAGYPEQ